MAETKEEISASEAEVERWERETLEPTLKKAPEIRRALKVFHSKRCNVFTLQPTSADLDFSEDISFPGEFPYTRGIHPTGYRGKLWTMRQFAGFSTPEETNARFKYLLDQGQHGLSVAYDLPTLMGYDADSLLSEGEVGKCGVAFRRWLTWKCSSTGFHSNKSRFHKRSMRPLRYCWRCISSSPRSRARTGTRFRARCKTTFSRSTSRRRNGSIPFGRR